MAEGVKPIYIAGRAHSGSTFLDVALNGAAGVKGCGGVLEAYHRGPDELCSCGDTVSHCERWSRVEAAYERRTGRVFREDALKLYRMSDIRRFVSAAMSRMGSPESDWAWYAGANNALSASIGEAFEVSAFVDSNKEYTRALMFLKGDPDAKVIHIFRAVDHTIASHYYRLTSGSPVKFMKRTYSPKYLKFPLLMAVAAGWSVGMFAAVVLKALYPRRVIHFSHAKFSADPRRELERLGSFLNVDLSDVIDRIETREPFAIEHVIGGNDFKNRGEIAFTPNTAGRRAVPAVYRWSAFVLGSPGMLLQALFVR